MSIVFWLLSIVLLLNSLLYYKAFVQEMEHKARLTSSATSRSDSVGESVGMELGAPPSDGEAARSDSTSDVAHPTCTDSLRRWRYWLHTEAGVAYFLNIVGSFGYLVSSTLALFLATEAVQTAREIDRATLWLDAFNMLIFIVDAALFWRVYKQETEEMALHSGSDGRADADSNSGRCVYHSANFFNLSSSVCYLVFICWTLQRHYALDGADAAHIRGGDPQWHEREIASVTRTQRSMYLAADLIYLLYAILLEVGWNNDHENKKQQQQSAVQLKDVTMA